MNQSGFRPKGRLSAVGSILGKALSGPEQANLLNLGRIDEEWASIVGPQLAAVCRPVKLMFRELTVAVAEAVWADSLNFHRSRFVSQVNKAKGRDLIDRVRLTIQPLPPLEEPEPPKVIREPTETEEAEADRLVAEIDDSELRDLLRRVILMSVVSGHTDPTDTPESGGGDTPLSTPPQESSS